MNAQSGEGTATTTAPVPPPGTASARQRAVHRARAVWSGAYDWALANVPHARLAVEVMRRWRSLNGALLAGNLTYRLFLWILPLLLVVAAALGFESNEAVSSITGGTLNLSRDLARTIGEAARDAGTSARYAIAIGLVGLVAASRSLIIALHLTFSQLWGLPVTSRRGMPAAVAKFVSSLPVGFVILGATMFVRRLGLIGGLSSQAIAFLLGSGVLLAVNWVLPRRAETWSELLPGSVLGGLALVVARHTALYYFENHATKASQVYGSLGIVAGLLSTLFVFAAVIVLNALVNAVWHDRHDLEG